MTFPSKDNVVRLLKEAYEYPPVHEMDDTFYERFDSIRDAYDNGYDDGARESCQEFADFIIQWMKLERIWPQE
jgi:hypothetical protein